MTGVQTCALPISDTNNSCIFISTSSINVVPIDSVAAAGKNPYKISKQTNSSANEFLLASYRFSYQLAMQSQFIATIGKSALTVQQLPVHENDA